MLVCTLSFERNGTLFQACMGSSFGSGHTMVAISRETGAEKAQVGFWRKPSS